MYNSLYENKKNLKEFKFNVNQFARGAKFILQAINKRTGLNWVLDPLNATQKFKKLRDTRTLYGVICKVPGKSYYIRLNWAKDTDGLVDSISLWTKGGSNPQHTIAGLNADGSEKSLSELVNEIVVFFSGKSPKQPAAQNEEIVTGLGGTDFDDPELNAKLDIVDRNRKLMSSQISKMMRSIKRIANPTYPLSSLIICGTPGVGKTFNVMKHLNENGWSLQPGINYLRAKATPATAAIALFNCKDEGSILVFDDCDAPWREEITINLFKAAFDQGTGNVVAFKVGQNTQGRPADYPEDGAFEFKGKCIFISNLNKTELVKMDATAVLTRGEFAELSLTPAQVRDYIREILPYLVPEANVSLEEKEEVLKIISHPRVLSKFPFLSIRLVCNAIILKKQEPEHWLEDLDALT